MIQPFDVTSSFWRLHNDRQLWLEMVTFKLTNQYFGLRDPQNRLTHDAGRGSSILGVQEADSRGEGKSKRERKISDTEHFPVDFSPRLELGLRG